MGEFIEINGKMREVVRVKSDNPSHAGYFTTYRDQMLPEQVEYGTPEPEPENPGDPPTEPVKQTKGKVKK